MENAMTTPLLLTTIAVLLSYVTMLWSCRNVL